jgi:membrane protein DedA with SNARE-associated domain
MDAWLPSLPYYVCAISMVFAAANHFVAIKKQLREPYYTYKILASLCWAIGFLLIGITATPNHPLRAEAATLIRSTFLAGGMLQLLWLALFARAMISVKAR